MLVFICDQIDKHVGHIRETTRPIWGGTQYALDEVTHLVARARHNRVSCHRRTVYQVYWPPILTMYFATPQIHRQTITILNSACRKELKPPTRTRRGAHRSNFGLWDFFLIPACGLSNTCGYVKPEARHLLKCKYFYDAANLKRGVHVHPIHTDGEY